MNDAGHGGFYGAPRIAKANEAWDTIDPRLVRALCAAVPLRRRRVWESAAGAGFMVDQLRGEGVRVVEATDIAPRRADVDRLDFLSTTAMPDETDCNCTNPPYGRKAAKFVRHALMLAAKRRAMACMLLPLPWITSQGASDLTGSVGFDAMVVPRFRARWMTDAEEARLEDGPSSPKMNHIWLVWNFARDERGAPAIRFVDDTGR